MREIIDIIRKIPIPKCLDSPNKTEFYNGAYIMKENIVQKLKDYVTTPKPHK